MYSNTEQLIVRLDTYRPRQRQGYLRTRIKALAVLDIDARSNAGPLKNFERLGVREKP
jgi:hypothetical protein